MRVEIDEPRQQHRIREVERLRGRAAHVRTRSLHTSTAYRDGARAVQPGLGTEDSSRPYQEVMGLRFAHHLLLQRSGLRD